MTTLSEHSHPGSVHGITIGSPERRTLLRDVPSIGARGRAEQAGKRGRGGSRRPVRRDLIEVA